MSKVSVSDIEGVGANLTDKIAALKTLAFRLLDEVEELQAQVAGMQERQDWGDEYMQLSHEQAKQLYRIDELLFGMDQPLQHPVNIDGLNSLFRKLSAAIKGEGDV